MSKGKSLLVAFVVLLLGCGGIEVLNFMAADLAADAAVANADPSMLVSPDPDVYQRAHGSMMLTMHFAEFFIFMVIVAVLSIASVSRRRKVRRVGPTTNEPRPHVIPPPDDPTI